MLSVSFISRFFALLTIVALSQVAVADEKKPACCGGSETVAHREDPKHDDGHDHAGHDHGGGLFDVIRKAGNLNTFAAALGQAELEEKLSHDQWTIFAPTDEAFAKIPPETLDLLLKPENVAKLRAVLLAHVVKGTVPSTAVKAEPVKLVSESGTELTIARAADGGLSVNGAKVTKADEPANNGIVHQIDTLVIPAGLLD